MTDTYLLPEVHIVITQVPGVDGTPSTARLTQIENDIADLLGRPIINQLNDIPDVDVSSPDVGAVVVYDGENWIAGDVSGTIEGVYAPAGGGSWSEVVAPVRRLYVWNGLTATPGANPDRAILQPVYGTTGSTVAEGNHTHTNPLPVFQSFSASGYMSGGSRQVVSRSVTLAAGISYAVIARFRPQLRGADPGAAYYTMTTNIAGNAKTSPGGATSGFWCVQGVPNKEEWVHAREIVGTGTSITVTGSVAYHSGAGFNVDAGELEIELKPSR